MSSPFAEPSWATLSSPYYTDSHRALQRQARNFYENEIFPHAEEWEEAGEIPKEACFVGTVDDLLLTFERLC